MSFRRLAGKGIIIMIVLNYRRKHQSMTRMTMVRPSVQQSGRVAVMIMLVLNLTLSMFYRTALARQDAIPPSDQVTIINPPTGACPPGVVPDTPESQELLGAQQAIHEKLFIKPFTWCTGSFWQLDDDVDFVADPWTPTPTTGETLGGEPFAADVYTVGTIDWTQAELDEDARQFATDWDYQYRFLGMYLTGPAGDLELYGISQSLTDPTTSLTTTIFMPLAEGSVRSPAGIQSNDLNCDKLFGVAKLQCQCREDYLDALDKALADFLLGALPEILSIIGGILSCIVRKSGFLGASPGLLLAVCAILNIAGIARLAFKIPKYLNDRNFALGQYNKCLSRIPKPVKGSG